LYTTLRNGGGARLVCTYCTYGKHINARVMNIILIPLFILGITCSREDIVKHFLIFAFREGYRDLLSVLKLKGMLKTRPCLFRATTLDEGYD
jgi:hypothetical protein